MKSNYHTFFTNLANPLKIDIILLLKEKERNVSEICKGLNCEQSKLSHALTSLKYCNLVKVKQKGKERIYSLNKNTIVPMLKLIDKHSHAHCGRSKCTCKE
ncbi:MAG: metalloregulator ArsR/SmtB family transcription factor [archaeon]